MKKFLFLAVLLATFSASYGQTVGAPYSSSLSLVPCAVTNGSLPPGVTLSNCSLSGTPTQSGTFSFSITQQLSSTSSYSITVSDPVVVTPPPPPPPPSNSSVHINYTDINVGDGNGAYVRIFGKGFGSVAGKLTLGNGSLNATCGLCSWTDSQIIAQLTPGVNTGNIVVATFSGITSNGYSFTVTPTTYLYVGPNGSDSNAGTLSAPFKTILKATNSVTNSGDIPVKVNTIIYLLPGTTAPNDDGAGFRTAVSMRAGGSSNTARLSLVGYPGGTATVGGTSVENGYHSWAKYVTLANIIFLGKNSSVDAESGNIRIINNDMSCPAPPSGLGGTACAIGETTTPSDTWVFQGNNVHDTGGNVDKTYHAVYFSSNVNHADVGWNSVGDKFKGYCRGIMFHATTGPNNFDIHIHDNIVHDSYCDGIALASIDPSKGVAEVYNNLVYNVARADNPYGVANEAGIAVNTDPSGTTSGTVQVYNNTVVNAGAYATGNQNGCFGVVTKGAGINLTNNICQQPSSKQPYIESGSTNVTGSNNLWFGAGNVPAFDPKGLNADPQFSPSGSYFLGSNSPAKNSGSTLNSSPLDIVDVPRGTAPSVGAYQ